MIPITSVFIHLPCPYGTECERPYCRYGHPEKTEPTPKSPPITLPSIASTSTSTFSQQLSSLTTSTLAPSTLAYLQQLGAQDDPVSSKSVTTPAIFQQDDTTDNYYEYAYHGYIGASDDYSQEDDNEVFQPVVPQYTPNPEPPRMENHVKKKVIEFSLLDDKPSIPVDLGDDEILMGLSGYSAEMEKKNSSPQKLQQELPRREMAKKRPQQRPRKQAYLDQKPEEPVKPSTSSSSLHSSSSSGSNHRPVPPSKSSSGPLREKVGGVRDVRPIEVIQKPVDVRDKHVINRDVNHKQITDSYSKDKQFSKEKPLKRPMDKPSPSSSSEGTKRKKKPSVSVSEEELRLLEKKTRLLKEYMATVAKIDQQIKSMETKQSKFKDPKFVDSLFEDDEEPQDFDMDDDEFINEPEPSSSRRSSRDSVDDHQRSSSFGKKSQTPQKILPPFSTVLASEASRPSIVPPQGKLTARAQLVNRLTNAAATTRAAPSLKPGQLAPKTLAASLEKGEKRQAHAMPMAQLLPLDMHSAKIALPLRSKFLKMLHTEFMKHRISHNDAVEMAQREEKAILDKSCTQSGYTSAFAGVVRSIRTQQIQLPVANTTKISITETMGKKVEKIIDETKFHEILRDKYLMTPDQFKANGYPMVIKDEDGKRRVHLEGAEEKGTFNDDDDYRRTCCRCGAQYMLLPDGSFLNQQDCIFHWKRAYKRRINRAVESRYLCCDADLAVKGCTVSSCHVHQTMRRQVLKQFVRTPPPEGPDDPRSKRVYAMDCEMVYTMWGMSVARVSVVDVNDALVLDLLIKPTERILDCNTKFSGLTLEMLQKAELDLDTARRRLFQLINSETILIGHSLESDLKALRLVHRRVVDTVVVFPHRLGPPYKRALRNLASDFLQKIIQEDESGHDSKDDSSACIQLMIYKVKTDGGLL